MPFVIRPAVPEDAPALQAMNAAFNGDTGVMADDVRRSLQAGTEVVLIAESDGSPAGFCCAQVHHSFCYPTPVAEVTELYVAPAFRRMGCAMEMLQYLEKHLRSSFGTDELHLLTSARNLAAQAAYEKAGFGMKNEVYMVKEVPDER